MALIKISNMDFSILDKYRAIVKKLTPEEKLSGLNSYFMIRDKVCYYVIREKATHSHLAITIPAEVDSEEEVIVNIGNTTLFHTIAQYTDTKSFDVHISTEEDKTFFNILKNTDTISLPHLVEGADVYREIKDVLDKQITDDIPFKLNMGDKEARMDILTGIKDSLEFIKGNERTCNALAIYEDRIVGADNGKIFTYTLNNPIVLLSEVGEGYLTLHKKPADFAVTLAKDKVFFDLFIDGGSKVVYIIADNFYAVLNNSQAQLDPASDDLIESLTPSTKLSAIQAEVFTGISDFFQGYYPSSSEHKPLNLEVKSGVLNLILKDSGVRGFNSCHVERKNPFAIEEGFPTLEVILSNSTLRDYLSVLKKEEVIEVYLSPNVEAIYLKTPKKCIYLALMT